MDRLDAMKVLIAAVDEGSLAGAARALERSPAAVGRAIAFLEAHVGSPLLHRNNRALRPSPIGEAYVVACRRILSDVADAETRAAQAHASPQGLLTVSASPWAGEEILRPVVDIFLRAWPAISVRMRLADHDPDLIEDGIDVALRLGALPDSSMVRVKMAEGVRRVIVAAPRYLEQHPPIRQPSDLARHTVIASAASGTQAWTFAPVAGSPAPLTVALSPRLVVNSGRAALVSAVEGLGLTRLYGYQVADLVDQGALRILLADVEPSPVPVHLLVPPSRNAAPKVRAFLDLAAPQLRAAFTRRSLAPPGLTKPELAA